MAVLAADIELESRGPIQIVEFKASVDIIYKGSLVSIDATGYAEPSIDTSALPFVGICLEQCDNSGGSAGDKYVKVATTGVWKLTGTALAQTHVGHFLTVSDDGAVTDVASTNDIPVGMMTEYLSATSAWVDISHRSPIVTT